MADDLGDEFWLEDKNKDNDHSSEDEDTVEEKKKTKQIKRKKAKKRKAADDPVQASSPKCPEPKKKKKRKRRKISDELSGTGMGPAGSEDFLKLIKETYKDKLSKIEWDEVKLKGEDFAAANSELEGASQYLQNIIPQWPEMVAQTHLEPGTPFVLILASSGVRAVDINRDIQNFKGKECRCAKLFAKHFKLKEQVEFLSKKICHLGIGTPNRVAALMDAGCLKLNNLKFIVIDWNWRDIKFKRLIDIPEVKKDMLEVFKKYLTPHIKKSSCKIAIL